MKKLLQHICMFEEFPNGGTVFISSYDRALQAAVSLAHRLEDSMAGVKGQLQAREKPAKAAST